MTELMDLQLSLGLSDVQMLLVLSGFESRILEHILLTQRGALQDVPVPVEVSIEGMPRSGGRPQPPLTGRLGQLEDQPHQQ
jgi:hypothetical protein